ncbi:MAG: RidA family protein [Aestuariivirgaceae bacterium]
MGQIDERLAELGVEIPTPAVPVANYLGWVRTGNLVFTAGQVTVKDGEFLHQGKVGAEISVGEAAEAAKLCAINIIAQVKQACDGDLDKVKRIVKLVGFVNGVPEFTEHPTVINGASDFMVEVFGDKGKHARSAVGAGSLPLNIAVEIEAVVEVE